MAKKKKMPPLSTVWSEARELILERKGRLALGLALMLVGRLAGMVLPASSKYLIDDVIGKGRGDLLLPLAVAAGVASLLQAGSSFGLSQTLGVAAQGAIAEMRKKVQRHVLRLPLTFFDSHKSGEMISRVMTDAEGIRNLVGTGLAQLVGGFFTATLALGVLFWLSWQMTCITLIVLIIFGGIMAFAFSKLRPLFRKRGEINAEVTGRLGESMGGIRIVKAYTAEVREEEVFAEGVDRLFRNIATSITSVSGVSALTTVLFGAIGMTMMIVGGRSILAGTMTLGDFVMYIFFTGLVATPVIQIASIGTQITEAFAGLDRIREIRSELTEVDGDEALDGFDTVEGRVRFEDVSFSYDEGVPVLRDVSFEARAGSSTALVGSSGSGKSTLIGLVVGFHRPDSGRILVDDRDLATAPLVAYRSHVAIVLQDNFLFDGTISSNIRYSRPDASDEEVREAARLAHCDKFVTEFTDGYETVVGERGIKLSGGQRQRLAIARAILADPRILILDEATSSLDSESEAMIQDGLAKLRSGRTTFVIAHRLSTIRSADQILVLEDGQIVERGDHAELFARDGRYRDLHDRQHRFESNRFINPGEDFTPEQEQATKAPRATTNKNL